MDPEAEAEVIGHVCALFDLARLTDHLQVHLGIVPPPCEGTMTEVVTGVVRAARLGGWERRFWQSLLRTPLDERARELLVRHGHITGALQGFRVDTEPMVPASEFATALADAQARVVSLEIDGRHAGSGFLVGADLVLTNQHVVGHLLTPEGSPLPGTATRISARFDFVLPSSPGRSYELAADWYVTGSRPSDLDSVPGEHPDRTFKDALDFALLRLSRRVGLGHSPHATPRRRRGWYDLTSIPPELRRPRRLHVFGHPMGRPLMFDDGRVLWINGEGTRVRYDLNTAHGASGAPCLDNDMRLAALHASGDPREALGLGRAEYGQGIPIGRIADVLRDADLGELLVAPPPSDDLLTSVGDDQPVLDRLALQRTVLGMARGERGRLLVVDGPAGTGRQFTRLIVQRLAERLTHRCLVVPCEIYLGSDPDELCGDLALELGIGTVGMPARPEDRQMTRWAFRLALWFCGQVGNRFTADDPLWVVFDCVVDPTLLGGTRELLVEIAGKALDLPALRVVAIGCAEVLPPHVMERAKHEELSAIDRADVARHLLEVAAGGVTPLDEGKALGLAGTVLADLPSDPVERWKRIVSEVLFLSEHLEDDDGG